MAFDDRVAAAVALTYVPAAARDSRLSAERARRLDERHLMLALTSLVVTLAIGLAYGGRTAVQSRDEAARQGAIVDLNGAPDASAIEPLLEPVFEAPADRRLAAEQLVAFVVMRREAGEPLPNVGAVLGATVDSATIERAGGPAYRERLQEARARAERRGEAAPARLALLNSADLALLKPAFVVRTHGAVRRATLWWTAAYAVGFWGVALAWWARRRRGDFVVLSVVHLLTGIGFAILVSRQDPLRDTLLFVRYAQGVGIGAIGFAIASCLDLRKASFLTLSYVPLAAALALSAVLILFGDGPRGSNAVVNLGPVQPIEAIRLLLALFLAGYFARRWEVLRHVRAQRIRDRQVPRWLDLPRLDYLLPVAAGVASALVFFFLQKDLGPALFVACVFLAVYAVARNRAGLALGGLALLAAGFYAGYRLNISTTLGARVEMWRSAWDNAVNGGDQVAQAIWAVATGGSFGTGLGLGDARYLPAGHTDLVLAAIGEELGFVGLVAVAGAYLVLAARGFTAARRAAHDYGFFLGLTLTLFLTLPVLVMAAGMLGVLPMTGVVTPFLSYGGSAMVANFAAAGLLTAIRVDAPPVHATDPFRPPMRALAGVLGAGALALIGVLIDAQVLHADAYAVRPHLGLQADGVRRYQYNPRVLDLVERMPRGTIADRSGLPLATSDPEVAARARAEYAARGVELEGCADADGGRCYPLGGAAFHLLGDAGTRRNWTATNTSYVERDAQDHLRGFDDHAAVVGIPRAGGPPVEAVRRDFRELAPLLRARHRPGHPAVRAFIERDRGLRLTIDAPLQARVAGILAKYAARSASGRAAAVVLDPDTGDLLAAASYPYPGDHPALDGGENGEPEALLDRARYGLYPPGSTFKLVTAAAALRRDLASARTRYQCSHQPGGRVGARIRGWGIVRDDVLDTHPHGAIGMHDALVRSCNAYFGQLAADLGPGPLLDAAQVLGISVSRDGSEASLRESLPQAAYGQGEVLATPLRMARVAAAIAGGGLVREARLDPSAVSAEARLLSREGAALLGQYLRDAVLSGTARSLRSHASRIAGKTGTAEVAGARSHSWFVGYAPHGKAERRVAVAVIIENAGYGAAAAAPAAGEIVAAAAKSGLVR